MSVQDDTPQDTAQQAPAEAEATQHQDTAPDDASAEQTQEQQQTDAPEGDQQTRDEKGRFKGVQPRIDELTRARREAEREAAYWRGLATQGTAQTPAQPAAPAKPTPEQFNDYGDYIEALTDWKTEQKVAQTLSEREAKAAERQQEAARAQTWEQRQAAARAAMPDFDDVVGGSDAPIAPHVAEAIKDSDHGPALAYHLAKHPDVLDRLNGMNPRAADRELGRLEERLSSKSAAPSAEAADAAPARTTNAPRPAAVNTSQGRSTALDPAKMTPEQYADWRSKGPNKARWAK